MLLRLRIPVIVSIAMGWSLRRSLSSEDCAQIASATWRQLISRSNRLTVQSIEEGTGLEIPSPNTSAGVTGPAGHAFGGVPHDPTIFLLQALSIGCFKTAPVRRDWGLS